MMAARYFPRQEVPGSLQLALIKTTVRRITLAQAFLGADCLFQPAPAYYRVTECLEVQRRVGQCAGDPALRQIAQQPQSDSLQASNQLLQRLAQFNE